MFDRWRRYSYADQKNRRRGILWALLVFLALFLLYNALSSFVFSMWTLENNTMQPGLHTGDRFVCSSYVVPSLLAGFNIGGGNLPFNRGSIVLVDLDRGRTRSAPMITLDGLVRFFSFQRIGLLGHTERFHLKRVVGLPGDEVSMTNFVFRVKPKGSSYSLTEFELAEKPYTPNIPQRPALWDESLPLSGNMDAIVLGEDECFVVSDDRASTSDSRTWGPVPPDQILGKALFRYWPPTRLGPP
jgi:signal peptidase I